MILSDLTFLLLKRVKPVPVPVPVQVHVPVQVPVPVYKYKRCTHKRRTGTKVGPVKTAPDQCKRPKGTFINKNVKLKFLKNKKKNLNHLFVVIKIKDN